MSTKVQRRREAAAFLASYVGGVGELLVDTTNNRVLVQDGATPGGFPLAKLSDLGGRNLLIDGNFSVNQRGYASGTAIASANYGLHDRWKTGGAGNTAYSFTQGVPDTLITVTSGIVQQFVEAANVVGGSYVFSWAGTIQGQIGYVLNGSYTFSSASSSPASITGVPAGATLFVNTVGTGTFGVAQLEAGTVPTAFERRQPALEMLLCQRYYQVIQPSQRFYSVNAGQTSDCAIGFVAMRVIPTTALVTAGARANIASANLYSTNSNSARFEVSGSAVGDTYALVDTWSLSAEL